MRKEIPNASRRSILKALSLTPVAVAGAVPAWAQATGSGLISTRVCMVTPEATEGPFYLDPKLVRADITEGKPGVPLRQLIQVVTADCRPVEGARVDLWHCDAAGNYSGYARQGSDTVTDTSGQTFLRGTQPTDGDGIARFETIYPGWYQGRATHMHYKVFVDDRTVLTSQIFFPDALSESLYRNAAPYAGRPESRRVVNARDRIAQRAGDGAHAAVREAGGGYVASLVVGIAPGG
jgi:protocatechuate 3,4-dioxygenase beta subunit